MDPFGGRLVAALAARGPLCAGIDPHAELLARWGLSDTPDGLRRFCDTVVDAWGDLVPVLKPQSAFFERFGSAGIAVLESTIRQCRERGALVLLDVKRGDVGSTMAAYAEAYLSPGRPLSVDAITVSPYPGIVSLAPALTAAHDHGNGVFILGLTSNPEGRALQTCRDEAGRTIAQQVFDEVAAVNAGANPLGSVGVVVGATTGAAGHDLSRLNGPVLAPGLGAQGATPDDLPAAFSGLDGVVLPTYSRGLLAAGPTREGLRVAAKEALAQCRKVLKYPFR
jgi:orotidine-5'-phosphate decarboxylase